MGHHPKSSLAVEETSGNSRRQFLKNSAMLGAGLVVGFHWTHGPARAAVAGSTSPFVANSFVRIASDNTVTVLSKHIEFGQGSYTGLATILAEELDADWALVRVEAAPAEVEQYKNIFYGIQATGGSTAIANSWQQLREAGAKARAMLVEAAALEWGVPAAEITVAQGVVRHSGSKSSATFGALAERASTLTPPETVELKKVEDFQLIGKHLPRVDVPAKSRGEATFTIDLQMPGMLTAVMARPPLFGAQVRSFDSTEAKKVHGVVEVVEVPRGVAVVAKNFWAAKKGRDALQVEWDESQAETRGSVELMDEYRTLAQGPGTPAASRGDVEAAFADAVKVIEADFEFPYLAHAPMEPLDAVARLTSDGLEIWAGSQMQTVDQGVAAAMAGVPLEKVKVHTQLAGGSFGRRATPDGDVVGEAASIVKALGGPAPVKLVWTREDDLQGGRYRPMYFHRLRAGLDAKGKLIAWHQRIVGQSILAGTPFEQFLVKNGIDDTSVEGGNSLPYEVSNFAVDLHTTKVGVPVLWWRSVGHTHNAYSTEVFLDEVAQAAGQDPLAFRLSLLGDQHPRLRGVLELVAEKAGWGKALPAGWARGIALQASFESFAAQVAEISLDSSGLPKVERVVCAVDCGIALNPDIIAAQMESGIGYGLGAVLFNEIVLEKGRVMTSNFHQYRPLRIHEMPKVEVHIVPSSESPTGVGEPGVPPVGPAVANAFYALTGQWVRRLPFINAIA